MIPCVVSQWSAWSGCAEPCKKTYRVRSRQVLQEPRNGGEPCPALQQRAGCVEYWSRQRAECQQALSESPGQCPGRGRAPLWVSRAAGELLLDTAVFARDCLG